MIYRLHACRFDPKLFGSYLRTQFNIILGPSLNAPPQSFSVVYHVTQSPQIVSFSLIYFIISYLNLILIYYTIIK